MALRRNLSNSNRREALEQPMPFETPDTPNAAQLADAVNPVAPIAESGFGARADVVAMNGLIAAPLGLGQRFQEIFELSGD